MNNLSLLNVNAFDIKPSMIESKPAKASVKDTLDRIVNDDTVYTMIKPYFDPENTPTGNAKMDQCKCILTLLSHGVYGPLLRASELNENDLAFQLNVVMRRRFQLNGKGKIIDLSPKLKALLLTQAAAQAATEPVAVAAQAAA